MLLSRQHVYAAFVFCKKSRGYWQFARPNRNRQFLSTVSQPMLLICEKRSAKNWGFMAGIVELPIAQLNRSVAQLVEQRSPKPQVGGSIPS